MEDNSLRSGVVVPGLQAVITGVFFAGVVGGAVLLSGYGKLGTYLLLGGFGCAFTAWIFLIHHWLKVIEHREGIEPEPEPVELVEPGEEPSSVRIELIQNSDGAWRGSFVNLPVSPEKLRLVASALSQGGSLSENSWCGSGRPFTKRQYHALRQELIERGWLQWRNPNAPAQGLEPSLVGRRVFSYLTENYHLPSKDFYEEVEE